MSNREHQQLPPKESDEQLDEEAEERFDDESPAGNSSSQDVEDPEERAGQRNDKP